MDDIDFLLNDYRLTTAEILYHMPDYPSILQSYVWQEYDLCPDFPELVRFLNFWEKQLDGKLHSYSVTSCKLINPSDFVHADLQLTIH